MTTLQDQLLSALKAAEAAIEEATDFLHYEDGEPVVARDAEKAYNALAGVLVEVDEAIRAATIPRRRMSLVLGQVVATRGAAEALAPWQLRRYVERHQMGDWGNVCDEDAATNDQAVEHGGRVLSAYPINPDLPCKGFGENCVWVITEADRSVTTLLLPEEY